MPRLHTSKARVGLPPLSGRFGALKVCAALAAIGIPAASAQPSTDNAPVVSTRPATPRHAAAQAAGTTALHLCTGYFATQNPRSLTDATLSTNGLAIAPRSARIDIDEQAQSVSVHFSDDMPPRLAVARVGIGCTLLPIGATDALGKGLYRPTLKAPDLDDKPWPIGDVGAAGRIRGTKASALGQLIDAAFQDEAGAYRGVTWGIVVIKDGKIVAERYQHGFAPHYAARTNSMCKSLTGVIVGVGIRKNLLDLHRKGILAAWRKAADPRGEISIDNLMHMTSGLYTQSAGDRQSEMYLSGAPVAEAAVMNGVDARPGTRFVYAGADPLLMMRALHEAVGDDAAYLNFPYEELLWKLGMTRTVIEADINNDFLSSGQCWSTARDFGRLGLLLLQDGEWQNEQLIPSGWARYLATAGPAQPAAAAFSSATRRYGAQFWLYGGVEGLPEDAFSPIGARGQFAMIIPSQNLIVVRRGFDTGSDFNIAKFSADVVQALRR